MIFSTGDEWFAIELLLAVPRRLGVFGIAFGVGIFLIIQPQVTEFLIGLAQLGAGDFHFRAIEKDNYGIGVGVDDVGFYGSPLVIRPSPGGGDVWQNKKA